MRGKGAKIWTMNRFGQMLDVVNGCETDALITTKNMMKLQPMILCPTNKQVKSIEELGYYKVSTIHQAKGLEYDNVVVIDREIDDQEALNIAYVAMTRARNNLLVANYSIFYSYLRDLKRKGDIM